MTERLAGGAGGGHPGDERVKRIELSYPAWEAGVLPLNYTRVKQSQVSGPSVMESRYLADLQVGENQLDMVRIEFFIQYIVLNPTILLELSPHQA